MARAHVGHMAHQAVLVVTQHHQEGVITSWPLSPGKNGTVLDWSDEELSSSSSRPNGVGAVDGGGVCSGDSAAGGGADGGITGASI